METLSADDGSRPLLSAAVMPRRKHGVDAGVEIRWERR
jgi:hypothetical protein